MTGLGDIVKFTVQITSYLQDSFISAVSFFSTANVVEQMLACRISNTGPIVLSLDYFDFASSIFPELQLDGTQLYH